jgi:hypothetical protein
MPNQEHLKILKQGYSVWNKWKLENPEVLADFSGADLTEVKLFFANLADANFTNANLIGADLSGADLTRADLTGANLFRADLTGVNLSYAILYRADLTRANFVGANFGGTVLIWVCFSECILDDADFSGAYFISTFFGNVDLSKAKLQDALHLGPSSIGLDTILKSKGQIPKSFLRGVGVPDTFIKYSEELAQKPFQFYSCFISYSHNDKAFARRIEDYLQNHGIRCWLDEKKLIPGDDMNVEIDSAIRQWDKVLLCCSQSSLNSWWVDKEMRKALKKEESIYKERGHQVLVIIPLNIDNSMFDPVWNDWKKQHLTDRMAADFTEWEKDCAKFEEQIERVIHALRADDGAREKPPKSLL